MDKRPREPLPQEDTGRSQSNLRSASMRYKPLAPRQSHNGGHRSPREALSPLTGSESSLPLQNLIFVTVTDPQQSKTQESRKLVRTQVMRNFARERGRPKSPGNIQSPERPQAKSVSSLLGVQELLNGALPSSSMVGARPEGATVSAGAHADTVQSLVNLASIDFGHVATAPSFVPRNADVRRSNYGNERSTQSARSCAESGPTSLQGLGLPRWPVDSQPGTQSLVNHCFLPSFRASQPLYMISIISNRPSAETFPFFVDIDSHFAEQSGHGAEQFTSNPLYQLAERSTSLAHALLMVCASQIAIRNGQDISRDAATIYHKDCALQLLNGSTNALPAQSWHEVLATIAVFASYEVTIGAYNEWMVHLMGFGRIVDMRGGITSLSPHCPVRRLIVWADQMGALMMNMRPFFPATGAMSLFFRPRTITSPSNISNARGQGGLKPPLQDFVATLALSNPLLEVLEDISLISAVGPESTVSLSPDDSMASLIEMRDVLIHRILSIAPVGNDHEEEYSVEECVRLAALACTLDVLFQPVLPTSYHGITDFVTEKLGTHLFEKATAPEWMAYPKVFVWLCFVGATTFQGNLKVKRSLIRNVRATYALSSFSYPRSTSALRDELVAVVGRPEMYMEAALKGFVAGLQDENEGGGERCD